MILLDTQALVWLELGDERLGPRARELADEAFAQDELVVSAITFCEVATLAARSKLRLGVPILRWRAGLLDRGLREWPVDGEVAIRAVELRDFHKDPADRLVVATALAAEAALVTSDGGILAWSGPLPRFDAHR